ncbi:MAG: acetate--CoA ligase family protein [Candidatus Helarchaeota archaeon]
MSNSKKLKAIDAVFHPKNVVILGASKNIMKWGTIILANIISGGYKGKVYPISLKQAHILGIKAYKSITELPETPDMVFICLPADKTPEFVKICGKEKANTVVIIAGGFREAGPKGELLEDEIKKITKQYPFLNIIGPNTMGVCNPHIKLYALMPTVTPEKGDIAFVSQSGNLGTQMMAFGMRQHIGFSRFVSSGNELILRTEDFIEYFGEDPDTKVIICYIEGIHDIEKFVRVCKEVSLKKPIIIFKAGKYEAGIRAAKSHTGALTGSYELYQSIFKQCGIIEAKTTTELIDYAKAFSRLPLLKGDKIGIISWGGGWGVVTADQVVKAGLKVPPLSPATIEQIDKYLPPFWSKNNPIDLVGTLSRRAHLKTFEILYESGMDGIIALGIIVGGAFDVDKYKACIEEEQEALQAFKEEFDRSDFKFLKRMKKLMDTYQKPIIGVSLMDNEKLLKENVVIYSMPEQAVQVMRKLYDYYQYRSKVQKSKTNS